MLIAGWAVLYVGKECARHEIVIHVFVARSRFQSSSGTRKSVFVPPLGSGQAGGIFYAVPHEALKRPCSGPSKMGVSGFLTNGHADDGTRERSCDLGAPECSRVLVGDLVVLGGT